MASAVTSTDQNTAVRSAGKRDAETATAPNRRNLPDEDRSWRETVPGRIPVVLMEA